MKEILLESGTNELEIVEFHLDIENTNDGEPIGGGCYGVNVSKVREIIKTPEVISKMSGSHPCIEGIVNIRGRVIPVINLPKWLGKHDETTPLRRIIITEFNKTTNGFLVNSASRIHRVSWEQVEPPTGIFAQESDDCITGVIRFGEKIIFILDFERIVMELDPKGGFKEDVCLDKKDLREGKKIFIAEDSGMVAKLMQTNLRKAGYFVHWDYNGLNAWQRLQAVVKEMERTGQPLGDFVHLLVSDIEMPQMDGLHLLKKVREHPVLTNLPVILFSSMSSEDNKRKWKDLQASEIITKPEIPILVERVDYHLGI